MCPFILQGSTCWNDKCEEIIGLKVNDREACSSQNAQKKFSEAPTGGSVFLSILIWQLWVVLTWFCLTTLSNWLKKLAPVCHPIRSQTKTNRHSLAHVFTCFASATCVWFGFWLVHWLVCVINVITQSDYFGFHLTWLWKPDMSRIES